MLIFFYFVNIFRLQAVFRGISRVQYLDLSHNRLAVLPTTLLRQTPALETLVLDNNLIETIVLEVGIATVKSFK